MNTNITIFSIKNSRWIHQWLRQFCNAKMRKAANIRKARGASVGWLLHLLLALPFCDLSIWELTGSKTKQAPGRDCFYRFLSNTSYNWRQLLLAASTALITQLDRLTGPRTDRVLIIDDSPYKRPRSKAVEYLGAQYDHSQDEYYRGFRLLTCGWSDGHSFVPTQMELLTNAAPGKRIGPDPGLDRRTNAGKRARQATRKATDLALEMIERSQQAGLPADYVCFDSWYAHAGLISQISEQVPVVCRLKNHPNYRYRYGRRIYDLEGLYHKVCRRRRSNPEGPIIGSITAGMLAGVKVRVVFIRDEEDPGKWIGLASTDLEITPRRICRIYAKRWGIEVFFKQIKQELGLHGELQVRRYSACIGFISIVFLRYMMLSYYRRQCEDERTIPGLFYAAREQLQANSLRCCLKVILIELLAALGQSISPQSMQVACLACGVIEQFLQNMNDNSMVPKPLGYKCES